MDPAHRVEHEGFVSAAEYKDLLMRYDRLQKDFDRYKLEAEARTLRAADKMRDLKERVKAWHDYIAKKAAKQAIQDLATPRASKQTGTSASLAHPNIEIIRNGSHPVSQSPGHSRITSSQTTEGEIAQLSSPNANDDSDVPVIVSARSLKRKRETPRPDTQVTRIKQEHLSSSPIESPSVYPPLIRTETSDLDLVNERNCTRQSQRRRQDGSTAMQPHVTNPFVTERPLTQTLPHAAAKSPQPADDVAAEDGLALGIVAQNRSGTPGSNSTVRTVKTDPGANAHPDARADASSRETSSFGPRDAELSRSKIGPLHDLSPNTPTLPRTSVSLTMSGRKTDRTRGAAALHVLSEDGDVTTRDSKRSKVLKNQDTPIDRSMGRLESLLEGSTPQVDRTILSPQTVPAIRRHRESIESIARSAERPKSRSMNKSARRQPVRDNEDPGPVLPEHEPLRSRPLHRLNVDDFKINPNFNDQMGFAYRETIRKREQRRCLPGCTRSECCGAIRKFVEAGGLPPALSDDELTLQGYLGSQYAQTIHQASAAERQKMLVEARAKAFADLHGKHRQAFERRTTPPGFWRTDMPTTQEMEEDREEARKMERQKVEERWRDAMRGGGRYLFRDE